MSATLKGWKQSLEQMAERSKAVALNKQIAQHASRKQLLEAMELFEEAVFKGWANSHTYSAAINANIRCGSIDGAAKLFERLRKTKGLKLDVITCTTMLKGFSSEGDISSSLALLQEMRSRNIAPNIRTFNTFFRGCVMTGEIDQAEAIIVQMQKEYKIQPDIPAWEYLVTLLCQGLRLDKVQPIVGRLRSEKNLLSELGAIFVNTARAAAILGDWKACRKAITGAKEAIDLNEKNISSAAVAAGDDVLEDDADDDHQAFESGISASDDYRHPESSASNQRQVTGGRKAWKSSDDEAHNPRAESLEMFKEHRRAELRREIDKIEEFMGKRIAAGAAAGAAEAGAAGKKKKGAIAAGAIAGAAEAAGAIAGAAAEAAGKKKGATSSPSSAEQSGVGYILPYFKRVFSFSPSAGAGSDQQQEGQGKNGQGASVGDTVIATAATAVTVTAEADPKALAVGKLIHGVEVKFGLRICAEKVVVVSPPAVAAATAATAIADSTAAPDGNSTAGVATQTPLSNKPNDGAAAAAVKVKPSETSKSSADKSDETLAATAVTATALATTTEKKDEKKSKKSKDKNNKKSEGGKKNANGNNKSSNVTATNAAASPAAARYLSSFREAYTELIDSKGFVDFDKVFADNEVARTGPVKLEICSGAGEWAVSQAVADPTSRWTTLELRHDRVYQTFARAVFSGANNVCVMGGDATKVLPEHIAPASVQYIFVNHPEPPQQIGGHDSQGKHLLTGEFFNDMARILKPDGLLTIVTDNHWYAKYLMRELAIQPHPRPLSSVSAEQLLAPTTATTATTAVTAGNSNISKDKGKKRARDTEEKIEVNQGIWNLLETESGIKLYEGRPGIECGVAVDASSYFDRLWKRGQLVERYFLVLRKAGSTLNIAGPAKKSSVQVTAASNKKIKFDD